MCYNPITIVNPTKYVSLRYRDRYLLQVPCGKCAQCQRNKSNEWYFRSYYQTLETLNNGGFVLFDTLTYAPKYLPHLSDYMVVDDGDDFPCFNSQHLRKFIARLRQRCKRKFGSNFTYFISSEYGTSERATHRPHYHALFYVSGKITPLQFSALVAELWYYGRTDGIPYKSNYYVLSNTFTGKDFTNSLRCCRYVSKYVQKSCIFQSEIDRRIDKVMRHYASSMPEDWITSVVAARLRQSLKRFCNQFHRQSTQFGASALADMDLVSLYKSGSLFMPDAQTVRLPIGLPTYYKRKLFYKTIVVDGCTMWMPTADGLKYLSFREQDNKKNLVAKFDCVKRQFQLDYDSKELASYVLDVRGRIAADNAPSTIEQRLSDVTFFNYVTQSDKFYLGQKGVISEFIGNSTIGYDRQTLGRHYKPLSFSSRFCYLDDAKEKKLKEIYRHLFDIDSGKQEAYELKQRLTNLFHHLSS